MFKNISVILKNMFKIYDSPVSVITDNVDVSEDEEEKNLVAESELQFEVTAKVTKIMRDIVETDEWQNSKAIFPVITGKDANGKLIIRDLAYFPNMLIESRPDCNKFAFLRSMMLCLAYSYISNDYEPQRQIYLFDDKKGAFAKYRNLKPGLITPCICKSEDYYEKLMNLEQELNYRRKLLERYGMNRDMSKLQTFEFLRYGSIFRDREGEDTTIIVIISELAELNPDALSCLQRILDFGKYVGIFTIVATDYPDSGIITERLKSVIPDIISLA